MNIVLNHNEFKISDFYFADKKRNVIIDGLFTKIIYSNDHVSMGGIYFNMPFKKVDVIKRDKEIYLQYNTTIECNAMLIDELTKIEYQILDYYRKMNQLTTNISTVLSRRLYSGSIKCHTLTNASNSQNINVVVKISGIWETSNEIGLAIKFIPIIA